MKILPDNLQLSRTANEAGKVARFNDANKKNGKSHVAIIMATYNGERFLSEQLCSLLKQSHSDWSLWISDDGSSDSTHQILMDFRTAHPKHQINVRVGPGSGSTSNFLSLLCDASIEADYYAICDQDDVWLPDKLARAIARLTEHDATPTLYGASTIIVAQNLQPLGRSRSFHRNPEFRNALVQNISGGNTMVFNRAAHSIIVKAKPDTLPVCHDWWLYQLITGSGGQAIHENKPTLLYRQHNENQFGTNKGARARFARFRSLVNGQYKEWNSRNIAALSTVSHILTIENHSTVEAFAALRQMKGVRAIRHLHRAGLFRQSRMGNLLLIVAALTGRL